MCACVRACVHACVRACVSVSVRADAKCVCLCFLVCFLASKHRFQSILWRAKPVKNICLESYKNTYDNTSTQLHADNVFRIKRGHKISVRSAYISSKFQTT